MAASSEKPVTVTAVAFIPRQSMVMARNSARVTVRSGSKKYCPATWAPVKTPASARYWAAASAPLPSVSA